MAVSVTMPRLGESVAEGTVTRWLKSIGDHVDADEPLLEVSTDKVDTEVPAPAAGTLSAIKVGEDETVDVGEELATIDDAGQSAGIAAEGASTPSSAGARAPVPEPSAPATSQPAPPAPGPAPAPEPQPPSTAPPTQPSAPSPPPPPTQPAAPSPPPPTQPAAPAPEQPAAEQQPQRARHAAPAPGPEPSASPPEPASPQAPDGQAAPYVTPLVRKLAAEQNVDLTAVTGTGVGGRIRKQDVLQAAASSGPAAPSSTSARPTQPSAPATSSPPASATTRQPQPAAGSPTPGRTEQLSRLRKIIAERMTESLRVSAQLTTVVEADVTRIARLRERAKADFERREGVKLSFLPFFTAAACDALKEHPAMNASLDPDAQTVTYHDGVHLGVAVDTDRGLLVPVIRDAGDLNLAGLARKIADLADRSRSNKVTPDELGGGTFTVTNIGSRGALLDTPIINQPQVGILGTGAVAKRPVVVDDPDLGEVIAVRSMAYLVLTYDHRLVDGADAVRFLGTVKERVEDGSFEADLGLA